ncbi:MAG: hypothetical protein ABSF98_01160 [Bryobacteraceae bacterium]
MIRAGALPAAETRALTGGALALKLTPHALALLEILTSKGGQ